jgi:hypothetical protein
MTYARPSAIRRSVVLRFDRRAAVVVAGLALAPILVVNGGYFPTAWGWTAVGFAWAAALAVLLARVPQLSRLEWIFIIGLSSLALWTAASFAWSISPTQTTLETQRILAFVAAALAVLVVVTPRDVHLLLGAAAVAATVVCTYALATRLFPDRIGTFDPIAGYRLSTPVGYWNSLGLVAAMAALLAASALSGATGRMARVGAAAALPLLVVTLYFTFSRGAWIALFAGIVALIAYERARLAVIARVLPSAALAAGAVVFAARERALTHVNANAAAAAHEGHRFAAVLMALVVMSAAAAVLADLVARRIAAPSWLPRVGTAVLALAVVGTIGAGLVRYGPPQAIPHKIYRSFIGSPPIAAGNLNERLFSLSGNGRWTQWKVGLHAFEAHPIVGIGAGGFERYWLQHRPVAGKIRDVHNLYLEALAETGVIGFALLMTLLAAPFFALRRARNTRLAAGALAAYVAYLVHAGVDWDWELSGVTLLALFCGASLLIAGRRDGDRRTPTVLIVALAAVVGVAGLVGLAGNIALAQGGVAARAGDWNTAARHARRAQAWAPWSSQPWQQLGEAELGGGNLKAAVESFNAAIDKSPGDWNLWFDLARATTGRTQRKALDHAARLNPLSPEIAQLRREIAAEQIIEVIPK